jgi:hypothetical protein
MQSAIHVAEIRPWTSGVHDGGTFFFIYYHFQRKTERV